ncbi:MAG TPA: methyltransferase domain-containing protein [Jiangellaceae bacterium]
MRTAENPTAKARRVWDEMAGRYDRDIKPVEKLWFGGGREWIGSRARGDVLEVAIGTGRNVPFYPKGVRLTGVELSPNMLAVARERVAALGVDADLREADAQMLPFDDESFDTVVCTLSLCAIPDDEKAIAEMARVLRPGGRLLLLDHIGSRWWPVWAVERLIELFTIRSMGEHMTRRPAPMLPSAGLEIVESERLKLATVERVHARKR